jgi:hypothetical protein
MTGNVQASLHGHRAFVTPDDMLVGRTAIAAGGRDKPLIVLPGAPDTVALFDDFLGDALGSEWIVGTSDTGQATPASGVLATSAVSATNGVFRMTSSATSVQTPDGGAQSLNTAPNWKANQGRLRFACRLKTATLAGNTLFIGLTDTGGTEMPAYDTGGGVITPAADYVGFIYSGEGGATQQAYRCVAGKAGADQVGTPPSSITPTANVYDVFEIELPGVDGGAANFYVNGKSYAQIPTNAITPTVALAAGVWRANTDGAANAVDIDYLNVSAGRDTGL